MSHKIETNAGVGIVGHKHPHLTPAQLIEKAERRVERVREAQHKDRNGHGHLNSRPTPIKRLDGTEEPGEHPAPAYGDPKHAMQYERVKGAVLHEVWAEFWAQVDAEGHGDPMGPAHDQLVRHYGFRRFYEERYAREQKRGSK